MAKHYYLAPAYPMLSPLAALLPSVCLAARLRWLKPALLTAPIVVGAPAYSDRVASFFRRKNWSPT
jgi:hypothetical protein